MARDYLKENDPFLLAFNEWKAATERRLQKAAARGAAIEELLDPVDKVDQVCELFDIGFSKMAIAARLGMSRNTVIKILAARNE